MPWPTSPTIVRVVRLARDDDGLARQYRRWGLTVPTLSDDECVTESQAKRVLHLRTRAGVRLMVARRLLDPAKRAGGEVGVTMASVEREVEWSRTATVWQRLMRKVGGILHWV